MTEQELLQVRAKAVDGAIQLLAGSNASIERTVHYVVLLHDFMTGASLKAALCQAAVARDLAAAIQAIPANVAAEAAKTSPVDPVIKPTFVSIDGGKKE